MIEAPLIVTPGKTTEVLPCEAPIHVDACSGLGTTKDHLTPRSVARSWRWKAKAVRDPMNLQMISPQCHFEKDRLQTPYEAERARNGQSGKGVWEHHNELLIWKNGIPQTS